MALAELIYNWHFYNNKYITKIKIIIVTHGK